MTMPEIEGLEPEHVEALVELVRPMAEAGRRAFVAFPPLCDVRAVEGRTLAIPAPGVVGQVQSWFDNGNVGVVAPMTVTVTSPITGNTAEQGEPISGQCRPGWIELVAAEVVTAEDARAIIAHVEAGEASA